MQLHELVPEGKLGGAEIRHLVVTPTMSSYTALRAMQHPHEYVPPGTYVQLIVDDQLWMSDTKAERLSCQAVVKAARGNVLIVGLGCGMILVDILSNPEVESVDVVEINRDVIGLMAPIIRAWPCAWKCSIEHADIYKWRPRDGVLFDVIWFDIWAEQGRSTRQEITKLHRKGAWWRKPGGWMASWQAHQRPLVARAAQR